MEIAQLFRRVEALEKAASRNIILDSVSAALEASDEGWARGLSDGRRQGAEQMLARCLTKARQVWEVLLKSETPAEGEAWAKGAHDVILHLEAMSSEDRPL